MNTTMCSLNIVVFFQEFSKVCHLSLGCYWLYKKLPANRSNCTLALRWELLRSLTAMKAREGLLWIVKTHNFSWTPCILSSRTGLLFLGKKYLAISRASFGQIYNISRPDLTNLAREGGWRTSLWPDELDLGVLLGVELLLPAHVRLHGRGQLPVESLLDAEPTRGLLQLNLGSGNLSLSQK